MSVIRKQDLLKRAAELIGRNQLASRLAISASVLAAWIDGEAPMPDGKLLQLATALAELAAKRNPS